MKVIGVGCGEGMLTEEAIAAILSARLIYGSARAIERVDRYIHPDCTVNIITDYKALKGLLDDTVILSTGDPLLAGLGYLGGEIISGISSLQVAFARVGVPWSNVSVINAHGKDHDKAMVDIVHDISRNRPVFIIADPKFPVQRVADALRGTDPEIIICQDLGEDEEKILRGSPDNPPVPDSDLFCCIILPERKNR